MTDRNSISKELQDLKSSIAKIEFKNPYKVPVGYFAELSVKILNRIKAMEALSASEELEILSPVLNNFSKEVPFTVPVGYFDELSEKMMQGIREHADYQTSEEEIAALSPLLSSLSKKSTYHVPDGYFENLGDEINPKKEVKVISISKRSWYRVAMAAAFIGIIALGGLLFTKPLSIDPSKNPQAWIKKNLKKNVSEKQLNEFVTLTKGTESTKEITDPVKTDEIKELMKGVSEKEIQEFLNDAVALESNDAADILLN